MKVLLHLRGRSEFCQLLLSALLSNNPSHINFPGTYTNTYTYTMTRDWVTEADEYVCNLSLEDQETARRELREDASIRDHAIQTLREWIIKNPRIVNCRLDANWLLRFLRIKKFSVPQSQEALERYLLLRQTYSNGFRHLDVRGSRVQELLDSGVVVCSRQRDSLGRRLVVVRPGRFDPFKYNKEDIMKMGALIHEMLMEDERTQINGLTYFVDGEGVSMPYLTLITPKELFRLIKNTERTVPTRHKECHGINCPSAVKFALDFGMSIIADKFKKRVFVHGSDENPTDFCDKKLLPKEYGGDFTLQEMIAEFKNELESMRDVVMNNDKMLVNLDFYSEQAKEGAVSALNNGMFCKTEDKYHNDLCGNFRKLEVD